MPPRFAYWTILIDNKPTAFRAQHREELLPTFQQLRRTNTDVVMKWFGRGRLWDTPEQAQWAARNVERPRERRGADWRPGGNHEDPRARFDRRKRKLRERAREERQSSRAPQSRESEKRREGGAKRSPQDRQFSPRSERPREQRRDSRPASPPAHTTRGAQRPHGGQQKPGTKSSFRNDKGNRRPHSTGSFGKGTGRHKFADTRGRRDEQRGEHTPASPAVSEQIVKPEPPDRE